MADYAHPEVLVSTDWVKEHMNDPQVKLVEIDVDTNAYDAGHIPGAIHIEAGRLPGVTRHAANRTPVASRRVTRTDMRMGR